MYNQLVESNQEEEEEEEVEEESDMEASDAEYNDGDGIEGDMESDGIPLGTTFRNVEQLRDKNVTTSFSETQQKPGKAQRKHTSYFDGKNKLPSSGTHSATGGGRLREIGGAMVGFLPRKLSTISSSREKVCYAKFYE